MTIDLFIVGTLLAFIAGRESFYSPFKAKESRPGDVRISVKVTTTWRMRFVEAPGGSTALGLQQLGCWDAKGCLKVASYYVNGEWITTGIAIAH